MQVGLNLNIPRSNPQNFKGLWGKTSKTTDFDAVLNIPKTQVTRYYYPFKDEASKDIKEILDKNTSANIEEQNGINRYLLSQCKLGYTLPCTESQYKNYYDSRSLPSVLPEPLRSIDMHSKDKYRDSIYGLMQKRARNPEMIRRENEIKVS